MTDLVITHSELVAGGYIKGRGGMFDYKIPVDKGIPLPPPANQKKTRPSKKPNTGPVLDLVKDMAIGDSVMLFDESQAKRVRLVMKQLGMGIAKRSLTASIQYENRASKARFYRIWRTQ